MLSDRGFRNLALTFAGTAILTAFLLAIAVVEPGARVHAADAALERVPAAAARGGLNSGA